MGLLASYLAAGGYPRLSPWNDQAWTTGSVVMMEGGGDASTALKVSVVWRAVNVLAGAVAMLPIDVFRRLERGKEPAKGNPWRGALRLKPNAQQTSFRWRHHMVGHALLGGNYYAHIRPDNQLWPLDPERMRVIEVRGDGSLTYEYRTKTAAQVILPQREVLHVRGFSSDGIVGVGALELMREAVKQKLMAQRARIGMLRNGLRPSVVIKHPGDLGDTGRTNLEKGFARAFGGPDKAGAVLVLDEGMAVDSFTITPEQAQWIESENFLVAEFLRFIGGVPGVLVGYPDKTATYASAEAFFQSFVTHCVAPITKNFEQELTVALFPEDEGDTVVELNLDGMLRADSTARATFYRTMIELGVLTRNEVRELENRNPLEGLDEPLTPLNMDRSGPAPSQPPPAPPPPRRPPADDDEEDDTEDGRALARAVEITRGAAQRLVRKEVAAIAGQGDKKGAAARFAADTEGWRIWVAGFYREHAQLVQETLHVTAAAAAGYCEQQRDELLSEGLSVVASWEERRVPQLVELALGPAAAPASPVVVHVHPAQVTNHFAIPPAPVGPAGPPGPRGEAGPKGDQGPVAAPARPSGPQKVELVGVVSTRVVEMPEPQEVEQLVERDRRGDIKRTVTRPRKE